MIGTIKKTSVSFKQHWHPKRVKVQLGLLPYEAGNTVTKDMEKANYPRALVEKGYSQADQVPKPGCRVGSTAV